MLEAVSESEEIAQGPLDMDLRNECIVSVLLLDPYRPQG